MNTPAGWYPDPLNRHEHRYWDGENWTEHVADQGTSSTDPLDAAPEERAPAQTTASNQGYAPPRSEEAASRRPADRSHPGTGVQPGASTGTKTNGMAIAALVVSILLGWIPFLGNIAAIVLGVIGRRQIRDSHDRQSGDGLALAGIVLGVVGLLLWIAIFVFFAVFAASFPWEEFSQEFERQLEQFPTESGQ